MFRSIKKNDLWHSIKKNDLSRSDLSRKVSQIYQEKWSVTLRSIKKGDLSRSDLSKVICHAQIYQEKWSVTLRSIKEGDLSRSDLSRKVICHAQIYQERWSVTLRSIKKNDLWRSDLIIYSPLGVLLLRPSSCDSLEGSVTIQWLKELWKSYYLHKRTQVVYLTNTSCFKHISFQSLANLDRQ